MLKTNPTERPVVQCPACRTKFRLPATIPLSSPTTSIRCPSGECGKTLRIRSQVPLKGVPVPNPIGVPIASASGRSPEAQPVQPRQAQPTRSGRFRWMVFAALLFLGVAGTTLAWMQLQSSGFPESDQNTDSNTNNANSAEQSLTTRAAQKDEKATLASVKSKNAVQFKPHLAPLVEKYCLRCHSSEKPKGGVILDRDRDDLAVLKNKAVWERVADNLRSGDMPPPGSKQPTADERELLLSYLDTHVLKTDCSGPRDPGRVTIRRLNRTEYNNTIRDLLEVDFKPAKDFPADDVGYGFDNIGDVLSLPPLLMERYLEAAEQITDRFFARPELVQKHFPQFGKGFTKGKVSRLNQQMQAFLTRAYRRPPRPEELKRYASLEVKLRAGGTGAEEVLRGMIQATLISPHFLFRIEEDPQAEEKGTNSGPVVRTLNEYELASRLAYFLWSSMPDKELSRLAAEGGLRKPGVLEAQVQRMLRDPKSVALADNFAGQWLQTRNLSSFTPSNKQFPTFNPGLRQAMQREVEMFFLHVARENRSVLEFIDADYTFVNEALAKHYGLTEVRGTEFRRVSTAGSNRGGVLTMAGVLAVSSNPTRTSPVKRGKFILDNILGTPPPPPPPEVEELREEGELKGTLRQRMEQHRANPNCATCHTRMDALGFGFENYDAVGSWRMRDAGQLIDASGTLPGGVSFKGPGELKRVLMDKKEQVVKCLTEKLLTYALGRGVERSDRCFVEDIVRAVGQQDYRFHTLVLEIVKSDPFQKRRAKKQEN